MEIRIRDTGQVMFESEWLRLHPNTSFTLPLTAEVIEAFGADVVFEGPQAQPTRYQVAYRNGVEQINGKWFTKYSVADMDADAKKAKDAEQAKSVREQRNQKLKDTDWTQLADYPGKVKAEYVQYRKELRDLPKQPGFPWEVTWPVEPA